MSESGVAGRLARPLGSLMLALGVAVFLVRLQHAGPYDWPEGGNLLGGLGALALGAWLMIGRHRTGRMLALLVTPVVFFLAAYAVMSELEEVIVLKAPTEDLRLWVVDIEGTPWVTMPGTKEEAHGLAGAKLEMLRKGSVTCVQPERHDDRDVINRAHRARHEVYAVQRFATVIGMFDEDAKPDIVALSLPPCPS